jgi:hypothetical protein
MVILGVLAGHKAHGGANNNLCQRLTRAAGSSILVGKQAELTAFSLCTIAEFARIPTLYRGTRTGILANSATVLQAESFADS